mmetsp:Transcript_32938/g.85415  ORF Transcript_32938/g.85415 Transcript_32938/m.85415 type:complete len:404 (-) Transcript_32938:97-1308(-)|eukprot:jgi/Tetstr1/428777/TSEL_018765.t1
MTRSLRTVTAVVLLLLAVAPARASWLRNPRRSARQRDAPVSPSPPSGAEASASRRVTLPARGGSEPAVVAPDGREKVTAIAGVFTGVGREYFDRRQAVRKYWVPGSEAAIRALQSERGVVVRFVMGFSGDEAENSLLAEEESLYGRMIRLDVREKYHNLVLKMRRYMAAVVATYDFGYALKVDDDVYHNPFRLAYAAAEWAAAGADYVGCFLRDNGITRNTNNKWFEPNAELLGRTYFTYPAGPTYGVSQRAAALVSSLPDGALRFYGCGDDCSVASWMLALNVTWHDDRRLCTRVCQDNSLTVRQGPGLKNPFEQLPVLHADPLCSADTKPGPPRINPDPRPNAKPDPVFDFSNTNCYKMASATDTSFEACLANHKPAAPKEPAKPSRGGSGGGGKPLQAAA